jgi:hypothetical protein
MKKKTMKKLLTLLIILAPAFVLAYQRYCEAHPVEKPKTEQQYKPATVKEKKVYRRTITKTVEEVSFVQ